MSKKRGRQPTNMPVRESFLPTSPLLTHIRTGLAAMKHSHTSYIESSLRKDFADSIDIDNYFQTNFPHDNRWDYLLGLRSTKKVIGLEPHSAKDGETSVVIAKKTAALQQLQEHMKESARISAWLWVASGDVYFANTEKTRFQLDQKGILFVGKKVVKKHLPT